jgi:hypothetical protein
MISIGFSEYFRALEAPRHFQTCFIAWAASLQKACQEIVAIDGKTLRHSFEQTLEAIHMVSAWACQQQMVLG